MAFVCTGNRFRSPLAAALLAEETKELPVTIDSIGTLRLGAVPALPEAAELGRRYGVDLGDHRARSIAETSLAGHDLALGFEWMHVAAAVVDGGAPPARSFTLPQLVDLLETVPEPNAQANVVERARARLAAAHAARPPVYRRQRTQEIADPLGRSPAAQRRIAEEVRALVAQLSRLLFA